MKNTQITLTDLLTTFDLFKVRSRVLTATELRTFITQARTKNLTDWHIMRLIKVFTEVGFQPALSITTDNQLAAVA